MVWQFGLRRHAPKGAKPSVPRALAGLLKEIGKIAEERGVSVVLSKPLPSRQGFAQHLLVCWESGGKASADGVAGQAVSMAARMAKAACKRRGPNTDSGHLSVSGIEVAASLRSDVENNVVLVSRVA